LRYRQKQRFRNRVALRGDGVQSLARTAIVMAEI
jgi:hypothetical protein